MNTGLFTFSKEFEDVINSKQLDGKGCLREEEKDDTIVPFGFPMDNNIQMFPTNSYNKLSMEEEDLNWKEFEQELLHPVDTSERTQCTKKDLPVDFHSPFFFPYYPQGISSPALPNLLTRDRMVQNPLINGQSPTPFCSHWTPPVSPFSVDSINFEDFFSLNNDPSPFPIRSGCRFTIGEQKSPKQQSSKLLERCRNGNFGGLDLDNIKAHIYTFATDQFGSRFIQQMYDSASKEKKTAAFNCLLPHIYNLSCDPFGNYIVQKLFASGDELQRSQMLEVLHGQILQLSLDPFGCRVMQKALETGSSVEASLIANEIKDDIVKCMMDQHGNHVAQRIIVGIDFYDYETILKRIDKNKNEFSYVDLSLHQYACRVIQSIIKTIPSFLRFTMTEKLYEHINCLFCHEYGNYVAQKLFIHGSSVERRKILKFFRDNLLHYSCNKYASNVIECCLKNGTGMEREFLVEKLFNESSEGNLRLMISDRYGNYVIQQMIASSGEKLKGRLISVVKSLQSQLGNHSFYKNVFNKCTASHK